jgi:hypothetical protein
MSENEITCPVCGATDHERTMDLFGIFPVILCPKLDEQRIVLAPTGPAEMRRPAL